MSFNNLQFPITLTFILLIFFIFSLYIFYIYFYNNLKLFFGNINKSLYIYSTILCIILFIPFIYYINIINVGYKNNIRIFIDLIIMISSFTLWIISIYNKNILFRNIFIIMIIIVNIDLIYVLLDNKNNTMNLSKRSGDKELFPGERSSKENILKTISIFGMSYLLFHHFVIDFILWNYYN